MTCVIGAAYLTGVQPGDTIVLVTALPQKLFDPFGQIKSNEKPPVSKAREAEALHEMREEKLDSLAQLHGELPGLKVARHVLHDTNVRETIERAVVYHVRISNSPLQTLQC